MCGLTCSPKTSTPPKERRGWSSQWSGQNYGRDSWHGDSWHGKDAGGKSKGKGKKGKKGKKGERERESSREVCSKMKELAVEK